MTRAADPVDLCEPPTAGGAGGTPVFDFAAFFAALDTARRERGLWWQDLAGELWEQSGDLNARRADHPLCGGAVSRLGGRGEVSCQYALFILRWLGRPPEDFLVGPRGGRPASALPSAGRDARLRWDLAGLHRALDERRRSLGLTWAGLGAQVGCSPARLTHLKSAKLADLELTMRVLRWLGRESAEFIHPASW